MMLLLTSLASASVLRHALIVGANEGGGTLEPLHYAESDAQRMAEVLVELGGFDPAYVTVLYSPTPRELEEALHEHNIFAGSFDEDLFLFYYSGHADARGLRLGNELLPFETLKTEVRAMPAEVKLGILDACRSGIITRLKGAAVSAPFLGDAGLGAEGEAWMTAASADESAQESDQLRGSFFTHYLVSGLRGAADDGGDGQISLDEAYQYAFDRVVDHTGETAAGTQHPNFDYRLKGEGDLTLTQTGTARATLVIPSEIQGSLLVLRLPDRSPVAEVAKVAGRPVTLALPSGTYKLRLTNGREIREATVGLTDGSNVVANHWGELAAQIGAAKGVIQDSTQLARLRSEGDAWLKDAWNAPDYRHSPMVAGLLSAGLPGAGQYFNGEWGKGTLYLLGFGAFMGTSLAVNQSPADVAGAITGPDVLRLSALMLYGASVADAAYNAQHRESWRPMKGWDLATAVDWTIGNPWYAPSVAGINVDVPLRRGMSLGADRWGWTRTPTGRKMDGTIELQSTYSLGSRADFYFDGPHLRPGAFVAVGLRVLAPENEKATTTATIGGGLNLRWYVTPRYFVQWETRLESAGGPLQVAFGGGLGVHFGN